LVSDSIDRIDPCVIRQMRDQQLVLRLEALLLLLPEEEEDTCGALVEELWVETEVEVTCRYFNS